MLIFRNSLFVFIFHKIVFCLKQFVLAAFAIESSASTFLKHYFLLFSFFLPKFPYLKLQISLLLPYKYFGENSGQCTVKIIFRILFWLSSSEKRDFYNKMAPTTQLHRSTHIKRNSTSQEVC